MLPFAINMVPIFIVLGVPVACVTIIARRMGRGRVVVALPVGLAVAFSLTATVWMVLSGGNADPIWARLLQAISLGASLALFVSLIVLAVVGVKSDRVAPVEAF